MWPAALLLVVMRARAAMERLRHVPRACYLRMLLRSARMDCDITHQALAAGPEQLRHYQARVRELEQQLQALDR